MAPLQVLFMGTAPSSALPLGPCLSIPDMYAEAWQYELPAPSAPAKSSSSSAILKGHYDPDGEWPQNVKCHACRSAVFQEVPEGWKNKRGNTSVVVRKKDANGNWKNILVDCGKTFIEQTRRFFPRWGVQSIDAVLITHGHADAYLGLDDLREWCMRTNRQIPIYMDQPTYACVAESFPYMVDSKQASGGGDLPTLKFHVIDENATFSLFDIEIRCYPVHHGVYFSTPKHVTKPSGPGPEPLICLGFAFDREALYLSDVSEIPERTWKRFAEDGLIAAPARSSNGTSAESRIQAGGATRQGLPVLIIDALWMTRPHLSHFCLWQTLAAALRISPEMTFLLGFTHPHTHYMWEDVCRALMGDQEPSPEANGHAPNSTTPNGLDLEFRENHPDFSIAREVSAKVLSHENFAGPDGMMAKWRAFGGGLTPAWDGLALDLGAAVSETHESAENGTSAKSAQATNTLERGERWAIARGPRGSSGGWNI